MTPYVRQFLQASAELVQRQQEVMVLLAAHLDVAPGELLDLWRYACGTLKQSGNITGTNWGYWFHGLECDLAHQDGRYVRVEFGPHGRLDAFSGYAVLQFVMTSKSPWREFPTLREHLAEKPPPYGLYSGSHRKMTALADVIKAECLVEPADPWLANLVEAFTVRCEGKHLRIELPLVLQPDSYPDAILCHRWVISEKGWWFLQNDEYAADRRGENARLA